jgi:hypothetical protein
VSVGDITVIAQSIGVASISTGFSGVDGILGLGPDSLTVGTVEGMVIVPTVMDNLASQGQIPANLIGISFEPDNNGVSLHIPPCVFYQDVTYMN